MAATDGCPKCNSTDYKEEEVIDPATGKTKKVKVCNNCDQTYD